ncbi:MAG: hypothetical protein ACOYXB_15660 [Bacteroidota bacterium]
MKKFFIRSFFFLLVGIVYFILALITNKVIFHFSRSPINDSNIIITGDSHLQSALDPTLFTSAVNICQGSEPIIVSYWKLKYLIEKVRFDTLILGLSYQNIAGVNDIKFNRGIISRELFRRTYAIQKLADLKNIDFDYLVDFQIFFKNMCLFPRFDHNTFIGNYISIKEEYVDDTDQKIQEHYFVNMEFGGISYISINYLDSLITTCEKNNIKLILISAPVSVHYFNSIPDNIKAKFDSLCLSLNDRGIVFLDYSQFNIEKDAFYNSDHLNSEGSKLFSSEIIGVLKNEEN